MQNPFPKKLIHLSALFAILLSLFLAAPVSAQEEELQPNPLAEQYILETLAAQNHVILDQQFPNEKDRVIGGQFFVNLLRNPDFQDKQWITLRFVTIVGNVEAYNLQLPFDVFLYNIEFKGEVNFGGSNIQRLRIKDSVFEKFVYFDQIVIGKSLELQGTSFGQGVYFKGAQIAGDLLMNNAQIMGKERSEEALYTTHPSEFWEMIVGQHFVLDGAFIEGETTFARSTFQIASFKGTKFGSRADFTKLEVERELVFDNASFGGEAVFAQVNFGDSSFAGASFLDFVTFEESVIAGDLNLSGVSFQSADKIANLKRITVGESLFLNSIFAPAGLDISQSELDDLFISAADKTPIAILDLTQAEIARQFEIKSANINSLRADGISNEGTLTLENVSVDKTLALKNAKFNLMVIIGLNWPQEPSAFNMRGMSYADIDIGEQGLTEETWQGLLYLIENSAYSPQAYQTLMEFLTNKGHPDWAQEVHLAMKRRERNTALEPFSTDWFWSWFLDIFTGYGDRPALAFVWSAMVVATGAWIYRKEEFMIPVDQDEVKLRYSPVLYSFALFIPYIDLEVASKWEPNPERAWANNYKYFHKILGWILMPIALLAFGGVLG